LIWRWWEWMTQACSSTRRGRLCLHDFPLPSKLERYEDPTVVQPHTLHCLMHTSL
jgi:hypothetical protein